MDRKDAKKRISELLETGVVCEYTEALKVALEALEEEKQPWKPKPYELYYFFTGDGEDYSDTWTSRKLDKNRWLMGNCYPTERECKFELERMKVIAAWKRLAEVAPDDGAYDGYRVSICYVNGKIKTCATTTGYCAQPNELVFYNRLSAEKAIDKIGSDRIKLFFFGVGKEEWLKEYDT